MIKSYPIIVFVALTIISSNIMISLNETTIKREEVADGGSIYFNPAKWSFLDSSNNITLPSLIVFRQEFKKWLIFCSKCKII